MPDLDIVSFWCCESVLRDEIEVEKSDGTKIRCSWEPSPPDHPYSMWWRCGDNDYTGCWPWRKNKECKHTKQAKAKWCGWDTGPGIGDVGEPQDDGEGGLCCPRCGGPVTAQRWGV